ncbi:unnamed protein product [Merluccius merluccius]
MAVSFVALPWRFQAPVQMQHLGHCAQPRRTGPTAGRRPGVSSSTIQKLCSTDCAPDERHSISSVNGRVTPPVVLEIRFTLRSESSGDRIGSLQRSISSPGAVEIRRTDEMDSAQRV